MVKYGPDVVFGLLYVVPPIAAWLILREAFRAPRENNDASIAEVAANRALRLAATIGAVELAVIVKIAPLSQW